MCKDKNNTLCKICTESMVGGWIKNHHKPGFCYDCSRYLFLKDITDPIAFRRYMNLQLKEMEENRYYMSEKLQRYVSVDEACMNYVDNGFAKKFHDNYSKHYKLIKEYFVEFGDDNISIELIHYLLGD